MKREIENRQPHKSLKRCFESFLCNATSSDITKGFNEYWILSGAILGLWWADMITCTQWELLNDLQYHIMKKRAYKGGIPAVEKEIDFILEDGGTHAMQKRLKEKRP